VNFVDFTLVRLATPGARAGLFDDDALAAIVAGSYQDDVSTLSGPFSPVFDDVTIGVSVVPRTTVDGFWHGGSTRTEGRLEIAGIGRGGAVQVEALWRGSIVARAVPVTGALVAIETAWPRLDGIDAEIIAALGSLPDDPVALENARRAHLLSRLRAGMAQPDALDDAKFSTWLAEQGIESVAPLLDGRGARAVTTLQLQYSDPAGVEQSSRDLPVTVAIMIRDAPINLSDLVCQSKLVIEHLTEAGLAHPRDPELDGTARIVACWIVPEKVFDDADWPGGTSGNASEKRLDRRRTAARWLAAEGIAIVTIAAHP
jgi:hypothetical protein